MADTESRRFVIELSVTSDIPRSSADDADAADELLDAICAASLPAWVFSVDGVDPQ